MFDDGQRRSLRTVVANMLDCDVAGNKFQITSHNCVLIRINTMKREEPS